MRSGSDALITPARDARTLVCVHFFSIQFTQGYRFALSGIPSQDVYYTFIL
jgi:hypothetical protein